MKIEFPDLKGQDSNTLYIIGNGFDLFHGLKTSYSDFHDWLINYKYTDFIDYMEKMFPELRDGKTLLWQDFETALGEGNPLTIHDSFFQGIDNELFDAEIQKRVAVRIKPTLRNIPTLLREWTESLPLKDVKRIPGLDAMSGESLFLSFNYTLLLEKVYLINPERILHIHNSLKDEKHNIITGHSSLYHGNDTDNIGFNVLESTNFIAEELNALIKPVEIIIKKHQAFFDSLSSIINIIVWGFSISPIDRLYFTEVFHHVHDNARWFFICKDEDAKKNYKHLVNLYNENQIKVINGRQYTRKMMQEHCQYILIEDKK